MADGSCPRQDLLGFDSQGDVTSWCHQGVLWSHSGEAGSRSPGRADGNSPRMPSGSPREAWLLLWKAASPGMILGGEISKTHPGSTMEISEVLGAGPATFVGPSAK